MRRKEWDIKFVFTLIIFISLFVMSIQNGNISYCEKNKPSEKVIKTVENEILKSTSDNNIDWWPMFGHDPQNTGYSSNEATITDNILWTFQDNGAYDISDPVVFDNKVFVSSKNNIFYCINAQTGEQIWNNTIGTSPEFSTVPAVANDKVYIGQDNKLYKLDIETGSIDWEITVDDGTFNYFRSPTILDNNIYISNSNLKIYCFNSENGLEIWNFSTSGNNIYSTPAISNDKVYFSASSDSFYCLWVENGALSWSIPINSKSYSPTISNDKVYFSEVGKVWCVDSETGEDEWIFTQSGKLFSSPVTYDNKLFIGSDDYFYCLYTSDGSIKWSKEIQCLNSAPIIADGIVYFNCRGSSSMGSPCNNQELYGYDISTGEEVFSFTYPTSRPPNFDPVFDMGWPVIADGKIFIGGGSKLYCIRDNSAPETPVTPNGPDIGYVGVEYTFSINDVFDLDGDDVLYRFIWDDGTYTDWITSLSASHVWNEKDEYHVKVRAKDIYDAKSTWSSGATINIFNQIQDKPTLVISSETTVIEENNFTVNIKNSTGHLIVDAIVTFNEETMITDNIGNVVFKAPSIVDDTDFIIEAAKEGYENEIISIRVLNKAEKKGWIWGRVSSYLGDLENVDVCVKITDTNLLCALPTDEDGQYVLSIPVGTYDLRISKEGYETIEQQVTIMDNVATGLDFTLEKLGEEPFIDEEGKLILEAKKAGLIVGELQIKNQYEFEEIKYDNIDFKSTNIDIENKEISLTFDSSIETDRILIIQIDEEVFSFEDLIIEYDNVVIKRADSLQELITESDVIKYWIVDDMILLHVPYFSEHTITIYQLIQTIGIVTIITFYVICSVAGISLFSGAYIINIVKLKRYIQKRK